MNTALVRTDCADAVPPLYAVTDRRRDGKLRIVAEFRDPDAALAHAKLLRWAGTAAQVVLLSEVQPDS